jgi:hypothetical protein
MPRGGFLHILNGDATRFGLEQSTVPGKIVVYPDVLHDGPTPLVFGEEWRRVRTAFLAEAGNLSQEEVLRGYRENDAALDAFGEFDEVIFWLEHDLFDQLLLIRHLHWLSRVTDRRGTAFSLICIGDFPGVPDFAGLGQLTPAQLASLVGDRQPIRDAQVRLGSRAWEAFCGTEPEGLQPLASAISPDLPFLAGALRRHLEDFPSAANGLARSETQILQVLLEGPQSPHAVFGTAARMEERVFMGDSTFWEIVQRLASGRHPLVRLDVVPQRERLPTGTIDITVIGRDVLAGRADLVTLNGIDRWMGGVHLTPSHQWRWDGTRLVNW